MIERGVSAQEFAPKLNRTAADVVKFLLNNGEMVTATQALSDDHMELFALDVGAELLLVDPGQQQELVTPGSRVVVSDSLSKHFSKKGVVRPLTLATLPCRWDCRCSGSTEAYPARRRKSTALIF